MNATIEPVTVKTLTAEVRVLKVGTRQITLSAFRQLDIADSDVVELMARVNDHPEDRWAIGRDVEGNLVRVSFSQEYGYSAPEPFREAALRFALEENQTKNADRFYGEGYCEKRVEELEREKVRTANEIAAYKEAEKRYDALPLVILAGLK